MACTFEDELLHFSIKETSENKGYWLGRPWVDVNQRGSLLAASVLAVPTVRNGEQPLFPVGSEDFISRLRELLGPDATLAVAIRNEDYSELALHSKAWRLPALFVSSVALPLVINVLANRIDKLLPGNQPGDTAEATLIIEGPSQKTLKLTYKGDPHEFGSFLMRSIPRFIDQIDEPSNDKACHSARIGAESN